MRRVLLDSNAMDLLADLPGAIDTVRAAIRSRTIELLHTHVTRDELAKIPDPDRRARLLEVVAELSNATPTGAFILGHSRLGQARLNNDKHTVHVLRSHSVKHSPDALIAITAKVDRCALITNDRRLTNRARECGIEVLTPSELLADLAASQQSRGEQVPR